MAGKIWSRGASTVVLTAWMGTLLFAQAPRGGKPLRGDAGAGAELYGRHCIMCHSTTAGVKIVGPSLYGEMKGPHPRTAAQVREQTLVGKGLMPSFRNKLDDQQIADLVAYIRKL